MEPVVARGADLASWDPEAVRPRPVLETDRMKAVVVALEPGQEIPVHAPAVDVVLAVLEGTGEVWSGEGAHPVRAGDLAVIPAGSPRGLRALRGRLVTLHVVAPPPTAADHAEGRPWPPAQEPEADPGALLREDHRHLLPHLEHLRHLADEVPGLDPGALAQGLRAVLAFLGDHLLPHAALEEEALYPAVEGILRTVGGATRTMVEDHRAVEALAQELGVLAGGPAAPGTRRAIQRTLEVLAALLEVHFRKEEEVYLPLLRHLPPEEASSLAGRLAAAPDHRH